MTFSDELGKLGELHQRGVLSDEEFSRAKARVLSDMGRPRPEPAMAAINTLRRSRDDCWLGGVCGGLARITGLASWIWRLIFASLALCAGTGGLLYLLLWIVVPRDDADFGSHPNGWHAG
jgi:phage shock protein PspC (stress-responsive transcriptional regulator)